MLRILFSNPVILKKFLQDLIIIFDINESLLITNVVYMASNGIIFKGIVDITFLTTKKESFEFYAMLSYLVVVRCETGDRKVILYEN